MLDFMARKDLNCSPYVGDIYVDDSGLVVAVTKMAEGKWMPTKDFKTNKVLLQDFGYFLADFHSASREYALMYPEWAELYPDYNEGDDFAWQADLSYPDLPKTPKHFGITHGDLHPGNWLIGEKDGEVDVAVFDYERMHNSWYLVDLGSVIYEITKNLIENDETDNHQSLMESRQIANWIIEAY